MGTRKVASSAQIGRSVAGRRVWLGTVLPPGRGPYVPAESDSHRLQYRKCGCLMVYTRSFPKTMVQFPGSEVAVDSRSINYEGRTGTDRKVDGVKYWLSANDSESDVTESCYPPFNDIMGRSEIDTDSDTPLLAERVLPRGDGCGKDSVFTEQTNTAKLQAMAFTHSALIEEDVAQPRNPKYQRVNKLNVMLAIAPSDKEPDINEADRYRPGSG